MPKMTSSQIRCLVAVLELCRPGENVASKEIAIHMRLSRPSVHRLLEALIRAGLVDKEPYGTVSMPEAGRRAAEALRSRHAELKASLAGIPAYAGGDADEGAYLLLSTMDLKNG